MTVKARLEGHEYDLEDLADWLPTGDVRVAKDDDGYYLSAPAIDDPPAGRHRTEVARELLQHINGIGKVQNSSFEPVRLGPFDEEGRRVVYGKAHTRFRFRARARGTVTRPDGTVVPDPPLRGPMYVSLIASNRDVAEAITLLASESLGWVELYKIYEIVRDAMKPIALEDSGFTTKDEIRAFTGSANRSDISGTGARHARMAGDPPKRTITIEQGREYISQLVRSWTDTLT